MVGARDCLERALAIQELAYGREHLQLASVLVNLAEVLRASGDVVGARDCLERALAIQERALGTRHPKTIELLPPSPSSRATSAT